MEDRASTNDTDLELVMVVISNLRPVAPVDRNISNDCLHTEDYKKDACVDPNKYILYSTGTVALIRR